MPIFSVVIAEDHPAFRQMLRLELQAVQGVAIVGEASDGRQLLDILQVVTPDLVILDISMPNLGGLEAARIIKQDHGRIKILFLTMHKNPAYLAQARRLGAEGYLLKEELDQALLLAIDHIRAGKTYVSAALAAE